MGPYRTPSPPPPPETESPIEPGPEDVMICAAVAACGLLRVGLALAAHEVFGAEATIAAIMMVLGVAGLLVAWRRRS
jgi:hypothetical protein